MMPILALAAIGILFLSCAAVVDVDALFPSPLKQIRSGILPYDVKCNENLVLIINSNGNPVCVKLATATRLREHGWVTSEKFENIHPILQQNNTNIVSNQDSNNNTNIATIVNKTVISEITNATSVTNTISTNQTQTNCSKILEDFGWSNSSELRETPKFISSSGYIRVLCVGVSPNPPKVGHNVSFILAFKNISDTALEFYGSGTGAFNLIDTVSPEENVLEYPGCSIQCSKVADWSWAMPPNFQVAMTGFDHRGGEYVVIKPGLLTITMNLNYGAVKGHHPDLSNVTGLAYKQMEIYDVTKWGDRAVNDVIQFNVNAIK